MQPEQNETAELTKYKRFSFGSTSRGLNLEHSLKSFYSSGQSGMDVINWLKMKKKKCQRTQRRAKCRRNIFYNFCVNKLNEIIKGLTLFIDGWI